MPAITATAQIKGQRRQGKIDHKLGRSHLLVRQHDLERLVGVLVEQGEDLGGAGEGEMGDRAVYAPSIPSCRSTSSIFGGGSCHNHSTSSHRPASTRL